MATPPAAMSEADIRIELQGQFGYQCVQVHPSQVLGTGSYSSVVKATLDHLPCAAKILHPIFFISDDPGQEDFATRFDQECRLLRDLKHPCIVQFLGLVPDPHNHRPILLMELMEESLTHLLECSSNPLPYHIQVNITHDITLALAVFKFVSKPFWYRAHKYQNSYFIEHSSADAAVTSFYTDCVHIHDTHRVPRNPRVGLKSAELS